MADQNKKKSKKNKQKPVRDDVHHDDTRHTRYQNDIRGDLVIVGGGLTGTLTALRIAALRPELNILLAEAEETLLGQHTWTFHESEIASPDTLRWLEPLCKKQWQNSNFIFPRMTKTRNGRCFALRSEDLREAAETALGKNILLGKTAVRLSESHVEFEDGSVVAARCVLDARGHFEDGPAGLNGFKKHFSLELELTAEHGLSSPILIDATCPQLDGFRYFQLFPWNRSRIQVTEVFYSDSPEINRERILRSIRSFVGRKGWTIHEELREESALRALPMTSTYLTSSIGGDPLPIGRRGGYYHACLGSSLPDALRIADFLGTIQDLSTQNARDNLMRFRRPWLARQRFYRLLNRWMFYAAEPLQRFMLFQQILTQPQDVVTRFAGGQSTWIDRLRLMGLRPPVPFDRALRSFSEHSIESWAEARGQKSEDPELLERAS